MGVGGLKSHPHIEQQHSYPPSHLPAYSSFFKQKKEKHLLIKLYVGTYILKKFNFTSIIVSSLISVFETLETDRAIKLF